METPRIETQIQKITQHLQDGKSITPLDALYQYGSFRLASVIHTLKWEKGLSISDTWEEKDGERYKRYFLTKISPTT